MELSASEKNLLLYIETCCTDYGGLLDSRKVNKEEMDKLKNWHDVKYIEFDRLSSASIQNLNKSLMKHTHAVFLSDEAYKDAFKERKAKFGRLKEKRTWETTREKRIQSPTTLMQ